MCKKHKVRLLLLLPWPTPKSPLGFPVTTWPCIHPWQLGFALWGIFICYYNRYQNLFQNKEHGTWCQSVSRTLKSCCVNGWMGANFCAQNCEAHRSLHQQYPQGSRRLAWRVKNWYAHVNGVMNGTCTNNQKTSRGWVGGWKRKKKQKNIACKICKGRKGMRKDALRWSVNKILQRWKDLEHPCWHEFKVAVANCIQKIEQEPVEVEHAHWCTS